MYGAPCSHGGLQTSTSPRLSKRLSKKFVSKNDLERFVSKNNLEPLTSSVRKLLEQQSLQDQNMKRIQSDVEKITKALAIRS